jgi:hypothetical protein
MTQKKSGKTPIPLRTSFFSPGSPCSDETSGLSLMPMDAKWFKRIVIFGASGLAPDGVIEYYHNVLMH